MKIKYKNPISGSEGDLLNMKQNAENVTGVVALFGTLAVGYALLGWLSKWISPFGINTKGVSLIQSPQAPETQVAKTMVVR